MEPSTHVTYFCLTSKNDVLFDTFQEIVQNINLNLANSTI